MKRILSLTLAALMVVSMVPTAFAADVDYTNGTDVEYTGSRTTINDDGTASHNAEYTITVPAKLAPGGSGTVTLQGMWPSDATVKVTADASVDMLNSITNGDKKTLTVTFGGIELAGSNTAAVSDNAAVSVSDMTAALFGTWNGKFNYQVEYNGEAGNSGTERPTPDPEQPDDGEEANLITFTIDGVEYQAEEGMTLRQWVNSKYNTAGFKITYGTVKTANDNPVHADVNGGPAGSSAPESHVIVANEIYHIVG